MLLEPLLIARNIQHEVVHGASLFVDVAATKPHSTSLQPMMCVHFESTHACISFVPFRPAVCRCVFSCRRSVLSLVLCLQLSSLKALS